MCWRDALSDREYQEEFESSMAIIREGNTFKTRKAYKGCEVLPSVTPGMTSRRYFRRRYWMRLSGPTDTTEIVMKEGTRVVFTEMPDDVRNEFGLRPPGPPNIFEKKPQGKWKAVAVEVEGQIGFLFGSTGSKIFFPLDSSDDFFRFKILSIPRISRNSPPQS